jgi:hypothetical protein
MKTLLIVTIFLINILFADNTYSSENSGKIDMHGGKTDTLSPTNFKNLDIKKPISPIAPKILIEDEKKKEDDKKETKK